MGSEEYSLAAEFKAVFLPEQKPAPEPVPKEETMVLSSYPALGQVTQAERKEIVFHAVLEVDQSQAGQPWQVALWHSGGSQGQEWSETILSRIGDDGKLPYTLQTVNSSLVRFYFSGMVAASSSLRFTLKCRASPKREWRWVRDEQGVDDGIIIVNTKAAQGDEDIPDDFGKVFKDLNSAVQVKSAMSQCPGTKLWSLQLGVRGADGDNSSFTDIELGLPWGDFLRWFALVRIWSPWLAPRHGKSRFELDKDAILCSFLNPRGMHLVLLAVSGLNNVLSVLRSSDSGRVVLHARNDGVEEETATVLAAVGRDCETTIATVMYHARTLVQSQGGASAAELAKVQAEQGDFKIEWLENWYDGLGFCTWNALGQRLTAEKVLHAVDTLAKHDIKVTSLIIDDNWQSIDYRGEGQFQHGWKEFEAEPTAFPEGLKDTISRIRAAHPNIQHIAVWHALLGYWAGLSPGGKIARTYKTVEVERADAKRRNLPLGGKMTVVAAPDVHRFYDDFYHFLSSCGIDAVKTDAQFMMDTWVPAGPRRELTRVYQDAWTLATLRHFSARAISCMSQTPQILFHSQLPRNRPAVLCRNSDDFFPDIAASHPWHVWANAHNSLLTRHLNVLPDWDMFQTVHDYSGFHAAARCVSGGPIYITDVPGEHNVDLLRQMTGVTPRGKCVVFRPSVLGRSIDHYVGYDDDALLKVGSYHGGSTTGTPILGIFNISARPLTELLPLSRFPGVQPASRYVVRAHSTGRVTPPLQVDAPLAAPSSSLLTVSLDVRGYEIYTAYPLSEFEAGGGGGGVVYAANLGLVGKMAGAAAIVSSSFERRRESGRVVLDTKLKALGTLGIYISTLPTMAVDDFMVTMKGQVVPRHVVSAGGHDPRVLEVDAEAAWRELGLQPNWSNEVDVQVYFGVD